MMLKQERQNFILAELEQHRKVISAELSARLATSEDTIRRDLNELAANGSLVKVHGGALAPSPSPLPPAPKQEYTEELAMIYLRQGLELLLKGKISQTVNIMVFSLEPPLDK
jgi:DeoR/GlpR family transcriptional regulator of sugar metabolism